LLSETIIIDRPRVGEGHYGAKCRTLWGISVELMMLGISENDLRGSRILKNILRPKDNVLANLPIRLRNLYVPK
jgi:hypothetical protein